MRKPCGIGFVIFAIAAAASAQTTTRANIFAGYSGYSLLGNSSSGTTRLNGWEGSLEGKFLPWIGMVADFGGGYGSDNSIVFAIASTTTGPSPSNSVRRYTYLFGPRVSVPVGRFTPFAHFLLGGAHIKDLGETDTSFATAVGGGLDYRLNRSLAWRLQLDNVHTSFFGVGENHPRLSTGINLRF